MQKRISRLVWPLCCGLLIFLNACAMVGPDFTPPKADVAPEWAESRDTRVKKDLPDYKSWWQVFGDPVLEGLVRTAYEHNLPLRIAGVRVHDARLQGLILNYQDTVLRAQQEVEDGLVEFLKAQERINFLKKSVDAAKRSADLALMQYRGGSTDYTTVILAQQALLSEQDLLAATRGESPLGLVAVYRALGGGWQIREGKPFVPEDVKAVMMERTDWGDLLTSPPELPPVPGSEKTIVRGPDW